MIHYCIAVGKRGEHMVTKRVTVRVGQLSQPLTSGAHHARADLLVAFALLAALFLVCNLGIYLVARLLTRCPSQSLTIVRSK